MHTYRVIYISPAPPRISKVSKKSAQIATSGKQNLLLERQVPVQTAVQALDTLFAHRREKGKILSISVVWDTYRVIHNTSPAQNLKMIKICPERLLGAMTDALARWNSKSFSKQSLSKPKRVHKKAMGDKCDNSWAYLLSYLYHQQRPESQNLLRLPPDDLTIGQL